MNIALVGAPGSGKSELAEGLKEKLDGETAIIDGYIKEIEKNSTFALGRCATYIGNLYVLLGRYAEERHVLQDEAPDHSITCGTLIETAVYTSLEAVKHQDDVHWIRVQNMMNVLGTFFQDTWRYDYTFVTPLDDPDMETTPAKVDRHLSMAITSFGIPYTPLDGTLEERVDKAMETIEYVEDAVEVTTPE